MKKYSLPVRIAALLCALCLLLTGCGKAASPDDPGEPGTSAPTAEPAAEKTQENPTAAPAARETSVTTETLPASVALPEGSGAYKVLDECLEEFARRELSDEEIRALAKEDLETARDRISTGGDFAAWLIAMGGQIYCDVTSNDEGQRTVGADFAYEWVHEMLTSTFAASLAVCVLGTICRGSVL